MNGAFAFLIRGVIHDEIIFCKVHYIEMLVLRDISIPSLITILSSILLNSNVNIDSAKCCSIVEFWVFGNFEELPQPVKDYLQK